MQSGRNRSTRDLGSDVQALKPRFNVAVAPPCTPPWNNGAVMGRQGLEAAGVMLRRAFEKSLTADFPIGDAPPVAAVWPEVAGRGET